MPCGCCTTPKDLRRICCFPLAPFCLFWAILLVAFEVYNIVAAVNSNNAATSYLALALSTLKIILGTLGAIAILARWAKGISLLSAGFKLVLCAFVLSFVANWVIWILDLSGINDKKVKWTPSREEWISIIVETAISVVFFIAAWWIFAAIKSLGMIVASGGSGWEGRNYKEIRAGGKNTRLDDDDDV